MISGTSAKKPVKRNPLESRSTLDAIHSTQVSQLLNNSEEIDGIRARLNELNSKLQNARAPLTDEQYQLVREREKLVKEIKRLENKDDLMDYYLQTGNILFDYYNIQDKISAGNAVVSSKKVRPGSIFAALEAAAAADAGAETPTESIRSPAKEEVPIFDREKLLNKYLQIVDPEIARDISNEMDDNWSECRKCGTEMIFSMNEAYISCPSCGYQDFILIDCDKPSYKDPPRENSYYAYKRINHFNEWLAQFQAKESTEIPQEIFDGILMELKKELITNMAILKTSKLREILRKLKYNKY
jgi:DNA-directed RNA polymerase subunit RPC12/RpoP